MKKLMLIFPLILLLVGCTNSSSYNSYSSESYDYEDESYSYNNGYEWAEDNDIDNFDDCQYEFGSGDAEDGCNDYVKDYYSGYQDFGRYECTEDCSGHDAGYEWAEDNDINDEDDCGGNSSSFIEGCWSYVEDNY